MLHAAHTAEGLGYPEAVIQSRNAAGLGDGHVTSSFLNRISAAGTKDYVNRGAVHVLLDYQTETQALERHNQSA